MAQFKCRAGDIGVEFRRQVIRKDGTVVDLTTCNAAVFLLTKPDGTTVISKTAAVLAPATAGWISWTSSASGDIDTAGDWLETFEVTMADGRKWQSVESRSFEVAARVVAS